MILLDTNLLTRLTSTAHQHGLIARNAIYRLITLASESPSCRRICMSSGRSRLPLLGRDRKVKTGLATIERASQWLAFFQRRFMLLPDREDLTARWHELVKTLAIRGFRSHDARLVAAMQCYGITRLLTFNGVVFAGTGVTVLDPVSV